jgi:hypothetical protein
MAMPQFFMRTFGQSNACGDPWTSYMDTAMLELTPALIDVCRRRSDSVLKLVVQDESLCELLFLDEGRVSWWEFYPSKLIERLGQTSTDTAADSGELVELTDPETIDLDQPCDVECGQMRVLVYRQDGAVPACEFGWGAYRKHCDVWVTTPTFTLAYLEELLARIAA